MSRLIDADALKEYIDAQKGRPFIGCTIGEALKIMTDEQPTIEAEPQWIPCSERLPEALGEVNVTVINRNPEPYYRDIKDKPFTSTAVCFKGKWYWYSSTCADLLAEYGQNGIDEVDDGIDIVAWMPLPKPYEVE